MKELRIGESVPLTGGGSVIVAEELGRGGQGIVYRVDLHGIPMALKWYHMPQRQEFVDNIRNLVAAGPPEPNTFLWPKYSTKIYQRHFGYVMDLRPDGYYEFKQFLNAKKRFGSFFALVQAAMCICNGFQQLHLHGYSYKDLNDGNFFINPDTGDVLICDNDNVSPEGVDNGIIGKIGYIAPEVVMGGRPDRYSDRFSLSAVLFMLLMGGHPLEGMWVSSCPLMTRENERICYGSHPVFVYDPDNTRNRPDPDVHRNVPRFWQFYPGRLRSFFEREFSKDCLQHPDSRKPEMSWKKEIEYLRDMLVCCPHCGEETFLNGTANQACLNCSQPITPLLWGQIGFRRIPLLPGKRLFFDTDNIADAVVEQHAGTLSIVNLTESAWKVTGADGKPTTLPPGRSLTLTEGVTIVAALHDVPYTFRIKKL